MLGWIKRALGRHSDLVRLPVRHEEKCGCFLERDDQVSAIRGYRSCGPEAWTTCDTCREMGLSYRGWGRWEPEVYREMSEQAKARWAVFVDGTRVDLAGINQASARNGLTVDIEGRCVSLDGCVTVLPVSMIHGPSK